MLILHTKHYMVKARLFIHLDTHMLIKHVNNARLFCVIHFMFSKLNRI